MKKLKSLFISAALFALSLVSCGTQGYHGRYQFQMGKANDAHIGIYMNLTTDKIDIDIEETKTTFEKFVLRLETPEGMAGDSADSLVGGLITVFGKEGLSGGYKIISEEGKDVDRLMLVPVIDPSIIGGIISGGGSEEEPTDPSSSSSVPSETSTSEPPATSSEPSSSSIESSASSGDESSSSSAPVIPIPSEFIDNLMIATYAKDSISITIPVSLTDMMLQLYWYGFDLLDPFEEYPIEEHPIGSHPTQEDIDKINETFNAETRLIKHFNLDVALKYHQMTDIVDFRDFNQLTMTLKREVKL